MKECDMIDKIFLPRRSGRDFAVLLHHPYLGDRRRSGCPSLSSIGLGLFVGASKTMLSLAISCVGG